MKKRVLIAGFGDTGLLVAIHLGAGYEVTGISSKPCHISGQELGTRVTQPQTWKKNYLLGFDQYKQLDHVRTVHGLITDIDADQKQLTLKTYQGEKQTLDYDILVLASGVTNGFWRNARLQCFDELDRDINQRAARLQQAHSIAIVGGGATGVSVASNLAEQFPEKDIHLFYSQSQVLPGYHPKVRNRIEKRLKQQAVKLHPDHRARLDEHFKDDRFTETSVEWCGDQPAFKADLTFWAIGKLQANNQFIPTDMLNEQGFVKADSYLRVPGYRDVFTVGDIAASDPNRSSARNAGFLTVAHNIRATLGDEKSFKTYKASPYRWGSILGVQNEGMRVFTPKGGNVRIPKWLVIHLLFPHIVGKIIYKGIRRKRRQNQT
jgi:NADH dehydrogenase FAD-containing subunit